MSIRKIRAVFLKEVMDAIKNKNIVIVCFMLPILSFVFFSVFPEEAIEMIIPSFISMHIIFSSQMCMASIIGEEKEKNTLKVLVMSNVKPLEYLLGIGIFVLLIAICSSSLFLINLLYDAMRIFRFFLVVVCGSFCSILLGAVIGIIAKNQASVSAFSATSGMVLGMSPMMANFRK
jgi:ABC-2 type transport system permease protein